MQRKNVSPSDAATIAIRELAERQHGVVARRQLIDLGIGSELIRDRVERGKLLRLHQGVFALGHRRIGRYGEWMAATLACGPGAYLSHGSALQLWGLRRPYGRPELLRVAGHERPHGVWLHQTRSLSAVDVTVEAGIPTTTIERALIDFASRADVKQLERLLVEADRSGRLNWSELRRVIEQGRGRKGLRRLKRAAGQVDPMAAETISPLEVDFLGLCTRAGLPSPQVNVMIEGREVDFHWPDRRVIVETDGYKYHNDRPAFERDHQATIDLEAAGYVVRRTTYRMLRDKPESLFRLLRRDLRA